MNQSERETRAENYRLKAQNRDLIKQAAQWQEKAIEYETALTKIYRESLKYAK